LIQLLESNEIPDSLLASLAERDAAVWLECTTVPLDLLARFLKLPWRQVISEISDPKLLEALETTEDAALVRRRGTIHIVDSDPSRIELPPRSLPIYLLKGRGKSESKFEEQLRRMTMLEELRRSQVRQLIVISELNEPIPEPLAELWASNFRPHLTLIRTQPAESLGEWLANSEPGPTLALIKLPTDQAIRRILERYSETYPDSHTIVRFRDRNGALHRVDVTDVDDPERPILQNYDVLEERHLTPLGPDELSENEFDAFFRGQTDSWRPYAAGLPWIREQTWERKLLTLLRRLDSVGPSENCIAFVTSESGAGGTTLIRDLAWQVAKAGYPAIVAKSLAFTPDALPLANFLTRANQLAHEALEADQRANQVTAPGQDEARHETPWLLVFDRIHWEFRGSELRRFCNQLERSGRPVCILVVSGPQREQEYFDTGLFKPLAELSHMLTQDEAQSLGRHLNKFLRSFGKARPDWQWKQFYDEHTVQYVNGISAFWITLSFWLQHHFDLTESIQAWVYRAFTEKLETIELKTAILEIAALSTERVPLPEGLLDTATNGWPIFLLLDDRRPNLTPLGLVRLTAGIQKYWALAHDLLGRLLINALFYDFSSRQKLGFEDARNADHLRFLILRRVSSKPALGETAYRTLGEEFATSVYKIDPDHGRAQFSWIWREVLEALDEMPQTLRDSSRVFRHHTAISRRRIAWLEEIPYGVTSEDKERLLRRAIEDIEYALRGIEFRTGSEPDLNLYNSLANAYFDLARIRGEQGANQEEVRSLIDAANAATRHAYEESPSNPYVVETYVKSLLETAANTSKGAVASCIEALEIIFSALRSEEGANRRFNLGYLADRALEILVAQAPTEDEHGEPQTATDVLVLAWLAIARGVQQDFSSELVDLPEALLEEAIAILSHPVGRGNMQVLRLTYQLLSVARPYAFKEQLEILDQLQATDYRLSAQLRLEHALLLYQEMRTTEGDRQFRSLRKLWRESELFVQIPDRLRWLISPQGQSRRIVQAIASSDFGHRGMAKVREFNNIEVPYRLQEFGMHQHRPGIVFSAFVTFGRNGPFLRPLNV